MTEDSDNRAIPTLDQNVVNQFLQSQNTSAFKSSGSVRDVKPKSEQKKRSESMRLDKNSEKKTSNSFINKYLRSLSDSLSNKRNGNPGTTNSKWYSNDERNKGTDTKISKKEDVPRKKSISNGPKTKDTIANRFDDIPKKKYKEQKISNGFDDLTKKKSREPIISNGLENIPKKKVREPLILNGLDDIPQKKSREPTIMNEFDGLTKKKSREPITSTGLENIPKKKIREPFNLNGLNDIPQKKIRDPTILNELEDISKKKCKEDKETQNITFRRKNSYVLAMQTDIAIDINIDEPPPQREEKQNSYVSRILSKFEDKQSNNNTITQEVQSDIDNLFKKYHRKAKLTGANREKLSLEINDTLLEKYKKIKNSADNELARQNSKPESVTTPEETEEVECITLVYNEDDGKLRKYSEEDFSNMEAKYLITLNDSTQLNEQKIEEIKVIENGSALDLYGNENETKTVVRDLCDKIQEQLDDVIKTIESEEMSALTEEENYSKGDIFEFWKKQSIQALTPKPDEVKNSKEEIEAQPPNIETESETNTATQEDDTNITSRRSSSCLLSSLSTNSDMTEDKPRLSRLYSGSFKRRPQQANEETKNKVEARNSVFNSLRHSIKSNCDEETDRRRQSLRNSMYDKKEENKSDRRRNSYLIRRKSSVASFSSNKNELPENSGIEEDIKSKENKRESIEVNSKKIDLLEPNRRSFLNMRRNSYTSNISEAAEEKSARKSVLRTLSLKKLSSQEKNEEIKGTNKMLGNSISSEMSDTNKARQGRLHNGAFRRSSTPKTENEEIAEDPPVIRQETPRLSRLYSGKFRHNLKNDTENTDDNNNNCEEEKKQPEDNVLQFESDNEDESVEIYNPTLNSVPKDAYTEEWVENTIKLLALQNVKEPEPVEEEQFSAQLRRTIDKDGIQTCTVYDEQNNPAIIRLSCYDILMDECEVYDDEENMINQSEKQYRESIECIQNNSQLDNLIGELKSTEQNYVKISLRRLVEDYMPEMNRKDIPPNLVGKNRTIFGNADILYENHKLKFLPALEASKNIEDIAECFLKYEEKIFKYYPLYTKNKPKSELIMRDYADFFKDKQDRLHDLLDLSSYLLTPIQRMAKYCQLAKSMVKECEKEGKPSEKIMKASEMLAKLMSKGNDLIALDSILNFDGDLRQEGDLLLRDTFIVQPPNRKQSYEAMIFLFQESILITQITRYNKSEYFEYQDSIKVCDMGYTDNQAEPLVFKIWYRKRDQKNYVIRANKKEKQQKWVKEIFNLLWKQLEANKIRKKKEYEESGLNETKLLLTRPISEPNSKHTYKSRSHCTMKKKTLSETIWYSSFMKKKFDISDS